MNLPKFDGAVEAARHALFPVHGVQSVILFGSAARGTATRDSDIDLFIDCSREAEDAVWKILNDLDDRFEVAFSPIFYRAEERDRFDKQFLESIVRHGRVLFGEMPSFSPIDLDLQPLRLVSYQTRGLNARKRAQMLRLIDGYRTRKRVGKKRYVVERPGFLKEVGGWRVGRGAVVIPEEAAEALDAVLRRFTATRIMVPIWCQRP